MVMLERPALVRLVRTVPEQTGRHPGFYRGEGPDHDPGPG